MCAGRKWSKQMQKKKRRYRFRLPSHHLDPGRCVHEVGAVRKQVSVLGTAEELLGVVPVLDPEGRAAVVVEHVHAHGLELRLGLGKLMKLCFPSSKSAFVCRGLSIICAASFTCLCISLDLIDAEYLRRHGQVGMDVGVVFMKVFIRDVGQFAEEERYLDTGYTFDVS